MPTGGAYGDAQDLDQLQRAAPLPDAQAAPASGAPLPSLSDGIETTPFHAPSAEPGQPVTHGADAGAGPGVSSLGLPNADDMSVAAVKPYLPALELLSSHPDVTPQFRSYVRRFRSAVAAAEQ